jgi:hypothetical protein
VADHEPAGTLADQLHQRRLQQRLVGHFGAAQQGDVARGLLGRGLEHVVDGDDAQHPELGVDDRDDGPGVTAEHGQGVGPRGRDLEVERRSRR